MKEITILGNSLEISEFVDEHAPGDRRHCVTVKGEMRSPSDGYHTFDELYEHRITLFIALCRAQRRREFEQGRYVWRSKLHSNGTAFDGWFILGIGKEKGQQVTYHLPNSKWDDTSFAETLEKTPEFDGHTSQDVLKRLAAL